MDVIPPNTKPEWPQWPELEGIIKAYDELHVSCLLFISLWKKLTQLCISQEHLVAISRPSNGEQDVLEYASRTCWLLQDFLDLFNDDFAVPFEPPHSPELLAEWPDLEGFNRLSFLDIFEKYLSEDLTTVVTLLNQWYLMLNWKHNQLKQLTPTSELPALTRSLNLPK